MKRLMRYVSFTVIGLSLLACAGAEKLKIAEVDSACKDLPLLIPGDPRAGSEDKKVVIEGFLMEGTRNTSGDEINLTLTESPDSSTATDVLIKVGNQNNQIQFVDGRNYTVKTNDGQDAKPKDKVRITGDLSALYDYCDLRATSIEKL